MQARESQLPPTDDVRERPRLGAFRVLEWWALLGIVWAPILACLALPVAAAFLSDARSPWLVVPWSVFVALALLWLLRNLRVRLVGRRTTPTPSGSTRGKSVVVIGAGPIGLAAIKELSAVGAEVTCFERATGLGGVYRYDPDRTGGVWPGTRLTSSPWVTAFSDFPPRASSSVHWLHDEYVDYLERYAEHFQLGPHLHFGHEVIEVSRDGAGWRVTVRRSEDGATLEHRCDHVAVSSGLNLAPRVPSLDGESSFCGEIRHLSTYKGPEPFDSARVVVVGLGESAVDVAHELATRAHSVSLSARRGAFIIPRVNPESGAANDYDTNRLRYSTPISVRNGYMLLKRWACAGTTKMDPRARLRHALLLASGAGPMSQPATKSDEFLDDVLEGRVALRPPIMRLDAARVVYADGTSESADFVLLGTGYRPSFPFLSWGEVPPRHPGQMYLNAFVPELGASMAFLGCARPTIGAIPPSGEMQARYFAQLVAGHAELPSIDDMVDAIARDEERNRLAFPLAEQPNVLVEWIPYLDRLAENIGCRPSVLRLLRRPRLLWKLMTGPMTGAMYRLDGPGASRALAEGTVLSLPREHDLFELLTHAVLHFYADVAALVSRDPRLRTPSSFV